MGPKRTRRTYKVKSLDSAPFDEKLQDHSDHSRNLSPTPTPSPKRNAKRNSTKRQNISSSLHGSPGESITNMVGSPGLHREQQLQRLGSTDLISVQSFLSITGRKKKRKHAVKIGRYTIFITTSVIINQCSLEGKGKLQSIIIYNDENEMVERGGINECGSVMATPRSTERRSHRNVSARRLAESSNSGIRARAVHALTPKLNTDSIVGDIAEPETWSTSRLRESARKHRHAPVFDDEISETEPAGENQNNRPHRTKRRRIQIESDEDAPLSADNMTTVHGIGDEEDEVEDMTQEHNNHTIFQNEKYQTPSAVVRNRVVGSSTRGHSSVDPRRRLHFTAENDDTSPYSKLPESKCVRKRPLDGDANGNVFGGDRPRIIDDSSNRKTAFSILTVQELKSKSKVETKVLIGERAFQSPRIDINEIADISPPPLPPPLNIYQTPSMHRLTARIRSFSIPRSEQPKAHGLLTRSRKGEKNTPAEEKVGLNIVATRPRRTMRKLIEFSQKEVSNHCAVSSGLDSIISSPVRPIEGNDRHSPSPISATKMEPSSSSSRVIASWKAESCHEADEGDAGNAGYDIRSSRSSLWYSSGDCGSGYMIMTEWDDAAEMLSFENENGEGVVHRSSSLDLIEDVIHSDRIGHVSWLRGTRKRNQRALLCL
ncbi:hypothetical protein BJ742DRAFT_790794 [Cladochytrium replicatum]|nr:hypothetical protein BJ742DRAFT_790794 [Cladochytrium replicatum]